MKYTIGSTILHSVALRSLQEGKLLVWWLERCVTLTHTYRKQRLSCCREQRDWWVNHCSRVIFIDENRFSSNWNFRHVWIWRVRVTFCHLSNIVKLHWFWSAGILVFGSINFGSLRSSTPSEWPYHTKVIFPHENHLGMPYVLNSSLWTTTVIIHELTCNCRTVKNNHFWIVHNALQT